MALIKCPDCGHEVSDTARACPECGNSMKNRLQSIRNIGSVSLNKIRNASPQGKLGVTICAGIAAFLVLLFLISASWLEDIIKVTLIMVIGLFFITLVLICSMLYNAKKQHSAEFRELKIMFYNKLLEQLYAAYDSDKDADTAVQTAVRKAVEMEKLRLTLYASREVVEMMGCEEYPPLSDLVSAIRNDLAMEE